MGGEVSTQKVKSKAIFRYSASSFGSTLSTPTTPPTIQYLVPHCLGISSHGRVWCTMLNSSIINNNSTNRSAGLQGMFWVQNKLTLWILGYVFSVNHVGGFVCITCVDSFIMSLTRIIQKLLGLPYLTGVKRLDITLHRQG